MVAHFGQMVRVLYISYRKDNNIERKLIKFIYTYGTIIRLLKNKTQKETQLKFYKVAPVPTLMYGCQKTWTLLQKAVVKIQSLEMKFLIAVKGCNFRDHLQNNDIRKDLNL